MVAEGFTVILIVGACGVGAVIPLKSVIIIFSTFVFGRFTIIGFIAFSTIFIWGSSEKSNTSFIGIEAPSFILLGSSFWWNDLKVPERLLGL